MQESNSELNQAFVARLIAGDYVLRDEDLPVTELIFSSEKRFPGLASIPSFVFKIGFLTEMLAGEINELSVSLTAFDIKDALLKERSLIYHKRKMDQVLYQDVDYYFIVDIDSFLALGYKRYTDPLRRALPMTAFPTLPEKEFVLPSEIQLQEVIKEMSAIYGSSVEEIFNLQVIPFFEENSEQSLHIVFYVDRNKFLTSDRKNIKIHLPEKNLDSIGFRIVSQEKPLIDSKIHIAIMGAQQEWFGVTGKISGEKTIHRSEQYILDIMVELKNGKTAANVAALLQFLR